MSSTSVSISDYLRLARSNSNFRKLWMAQVVSELGDWFYVLAIYSLLLDLTGKASSVALALVLQVLPQTFVGPLAGVVNDRLSRRKVMIFADLARMVVVGCMLLVRSAQTVWVVFPLLFLETVMAAFFEPARNSVIPNITAGQEVIVANTMASTTWSFNLALGGLFGGLVAAALGRDAVFVLNALSFLASALLIRRMHFTEGHLAGFGKVTIRELFDYSPMPRGATLHFTHPEAVGHGSGQGRDRRARHGLGAVSSTGATRAASAQRRHSSRAGRTVRDEPVDGGARGRRDHRTSRRHAMGWHRAAAATVRHALWLCAGRARLLVARTHLQPAVGVRVGDDCACRRLHRLGILDHCFATEYRRSLPRASIRRGHGTADAGDRDVLLDRRTGY